MQFNLDNFYTKLSVVKREKSRWIKTKKNVELSDMFDKDEESGSNPRIILIEGSPRTSKTTLSLKLAYDWATGKMPNKFPEVELVLLIKCRDMEDSIQESAKTQLLPWDNDHLRNALDSFIHSGKIMLIVDGIDEIPKSAESHVVNLLKRKVLQNCYVVVTSRQEKGMEVRKCCDKLLEIDDFSDKSRGRFIKRYFTSNNYLAKKLQEKIQTSTESENNLQSLATNPLNLLLLCVVFEDNDGDLPTTVTELYENIVECIWIRYCKRKKPEEKAISFEIAMQTLGKLAYECLIERDTLYFREGMLKNEDEKLCTNIGFLYKDDISTRILEPDYTYCFLHKTFQEYLAAYHCVYIEKDIDVSKLSFYTHKDGAKFTQVLKFVSSMLQKESAEHHKQIIEQLGSCISQNDECDNDAALDIMCQVLSENKLDKDLAGTFKPFISEDLELVIKPDNKCSIMPRILNLLATGGEDKEILKLHLLQFQDFREGTEWLRLISEALMKNLVVDEIALWHCELDETFLQQMLSGNSILWTLNIANNSMTYQAVNTLAKGLCNNTTLRILILINIRLGLHDKPSSQFTGMAEMLKTNVTLKYLYLNKNALGSGGVTWIAEALESNQGLRLLSLSETECDDIGAAALANMLRMNKTLESLYICNASTTVRYHNIIGDKGATALADVLKEYNSSLRKLHLCDNTNITNTGLRKLIEAVQKNKRLTLYIDLPEQISITLDDGTMKRIKPDCNFTQGKITTTSYTSALLAEF